MQTHIELAFGDGEYRFSLRLPQIIAIEEKCGPIGEVQARIFNSFHGNPSFRYADLVEPIRQALIGGGGGLVDGVEVIVSPIKANQLIESYVHDRPMIEVLQTAYAIMTGRYFGYEPIDETQKKSMTPSGDQASPSASTGEKSSPTAL